MHAEAFIEQVNAAAGKKAVKAPESWNAAAPSQKNPAGLKNPKIDAAKVAEVASVEDMMSPAYALKQNGWTVGALLCAAKEPNVVFKIEQIDADGFEVRSVTTPPRKLHIAFAECDEWKLHNGKILEKIPCENSSPVNSTAWSIEAVKARITLALRHLSSMDTGSAEALAAFKNPTEVGCAESFKKGELVLVPMTQRINIGKLSPSMVTLGPLLYPPKPADPVHFHLSQQVVYPTDKKQGAEAWVPFFWLVHSGSAVDKKADANMVMKEEVVHVDVSTKSEERKWDMRIPTMVNCRALEKGQVLKVFVPSNEAGRAEAVEPTAKRQRR